MDKTRRTHAEKVRLSLEHDIFEGRLLPGAALDEEAIARRFEVSRTPVREAILQLVQSGLVEKRPRQGAIVARADLRQMIQMFELMGELEAICSRMAARRISRAERAALEAEHARAGEALSAGDQEAYYRASRNFHLMVIAASHNQPLIETTNKLGVQLVPYRRFQLRYPDRPEANFREHGEILEAIFAGDGDLAARLFRKHTTVQGDVLADYISLPSEPEVELLDETG